jgi:hypothetical protein
MPAEPARRVAVQRCADAIAGWAVLPLDLDVQVGAAKVWSSGWKSSLNTMGLPRKSGGGTRSSGRMAVRMSLRSAIVVSMSIIVPAANRFPQAPRAALLEQPAIHPKIDTS